MSKHLVSTSTWRSAKEAPRTIAPAVAGRPHITPACESHIHTRKTICVYIYIYFCTRKNIRTLICTIMDVGYVFHDCVFNLLVYNRDVRVLFKFVPLIMSVLILTLIVKISIEISLYVCMYVYMYM